MHQAEVEEACQGSPLLIWLALQRGTPPARPWAGKEPASQPHFGSPEIADACQAGVRLQGLVRSLAVVYSSLIRALVILSDERAA
jgi:hypothetical protein